MAGVITRATSQDDLRAVLKAAQSHPLAPLCERYARGEATLHIHFIDQLSVETQWRGRYCAHIHAVRIEHPAIGVLDAAHESRLCRDNVKNQGVMLVSIAEVLQDREEMAVPAVPSLVRLMPLDYCENFRPLDATYLSVITRNIFPLYRLVDEDGELRLEGNLSVVASNECARKMIERGTHLMQSVAGQHTETWIDGPIGPEVLERFLRVRIVINEHSVRCFVQKGLGFPFKLLDMLIGPM